MPSADRTAYTKRRMRRRYLKQGPRRKLSGILSIRSTAIRPGRSLRVFEIKTDATDFHLIVRHPAPALLCPCQQSLDIGNNEINPTQTVSAPICGLNKADVGILQRKAPAALIVLSEWHTCDVCPSLSHGLRVMGLQFNS